MRQEGLKSSHAKKFRVVTTDSDHHLPVAPNLMAQDFVADKPNEKWAGDITYVRTQEGWLYLATIIDLYSRKIVGLAMADHLRKELCTEALRSSLAFRQPDQQLLHHSDRGSQYASDDYQEILRQHGCIVSMSRKGNCYDNAVVESFFHTLKVECVYQTNYQTRQHAKEDITDYIFNFYNCSRKHSALDYQAPIQYEQMAA
jgi:transposase InsO family protein